MYYTSYGNAQTADENIPCELSEIPVIIKPNAVSYPGAVMVHSKHISVAHTAVMGPGWPASLGFFAGGASGCHQVFAYGHLA